MKTQRDYWSRLFLAGGNLNNRDAAGSAYLNLNNGPGNVQPARHARGFWSAWALHLFIKELLTQ